MHNRKVKEVHEPALKRAVTGGTTDAEDEPEIIINEFVLSKKMDKFVAISNDLKNESYKLSLVEI